ncbi:hypothetical protein AKG99_10275 (plasmid) [Escherichia coli]|nr:hypothetical protein AKG99_10275 [Escherichia coli]
MFVHVVDAVDLFCLLLWLCDGGRKPEKTAATGNCVVVACYWQVVYGVWAQFWPAGTCPYNL